MRIIYPGGQRLFLEDGPFFFFFLTCDLFSLLENGLVIFLSVGVMGSSSDKFCMITQI